MTALARALTGFETITLDEINSVAELQTRTDRKYLIDEPTLMALVEAMSPTTRVLVVDGEPTCRYRSTYFDTADLSLYRAAVQGRRKRYKIRSRTYGATGPCFLEIKAKGRRSTTVKSRIDYLRSDSGSINTAGVEFIEHVTGRSDLAEALQPVLTTEYIRSTLVEPASGTRVTVDRRLRCRDEAGAEALLDAIIVETKSTGAPSATDEWLWGRHIRPTKVSKFGTGLATLHAELPGNKWHRTIARHWKITGPSSPLTIHPKRFTP